MHNLQSHYLNIMNIESFGINNLDPHQRKVGNYKSQKCMFIFGRYVPNQTLSSTIPSLTS